VKRAILVAFGGFLTLGWASPGAAQIPAQGLSALVCLAGVHGNGTYVIGPSGKLVVEVSGDSGSSATVKITHGGDDSTHALVYEDVNQNGVLDCGDRIQSVT
jgi:hypothetical protein